MGESGTHVPNHNHHQPLKELPCPPEASSYRAASLLSAVTTSVVSQVTPMLSRDMGTKGIAMHLLTCLHFRHLPCSVGTCSWGQWPTTAGLQSPHSSRLTQKRFQLAYLTPLLHSGFTATFNSTLLPLMSQSSHKHWTANIKKIKN